MYSYQQHAQGSTPYPHFSYPTAAWPYAYPFPSTNLQQRAQAAVAAAPFQPYQPPTAVRSSTPAAPPPSSSAGTSNQSGTATAAAPTQQKSGRTRNTTIKGTFAKELKALMYGFGDVKQPDNDTVNVLEEILVEYIADVCQTAAGPTRKTRLQIEDLRRALGKPADSKKLARMEELLFLQEDIKRARKLVPESDTDMLAYE